MMFARGVAPKTNESLVGFLMRIGELNRLPTVSVFEMLRGRVVCPRRVEAAVQIAAACQCSVPEIVQLFGFEHPHPSGRRAWRLGREWVTKANFVSSRSMAVCPHCLAQERYLPGIWELTFYSCCTEHRSQLLTHCPVCHKALRWTRPSISRCGCGFDLREAKGKPPGEYALAVATLIRTKVTAGPLPENNAAIPHNVAARLADLSLDGLFKTLWFLGHRIGDFEACTSGHGRRKPRSADIEAIIDKAAALLCAWPTSLRERCEAIAHRALSKGAKDLYGRAFRPIFAYLDEDFAERELAFVRVAYEQHIRQLWRDRGLFPPAHLGPQLELKLDHS